MLKRMSVKKISVPVMNNIHKFIGKTNRKKSTGPGY